MSDIQLLDCTLRDGGHIVDSRFGFKVIRSIINSLQESGIEIIEGGFLQDCNFDENRAMFNTVEEAKKILPPKKKGIQYSLMAQADLYDIEKLEKNDGFIDIVRISFHDNHISMGLNYCRKVIEKGYKCFVNPINLLGYSDFELMNLVEEVNAIHPYALTIVDTFGAMLKQDLRRIYYLLEHNLAPDIRIALHLHENQALSYSLAQDFIEMRLASRNICIDGSLLGMGRIPGNLCIELIMSYLNRMEIKSYDLDSVFDVIDMHIRSMKEQHSWGYSTEYALSARFRVHRSYAEYLYVMQRLKTKQINQILAMVAPEKASRFDKDYIEKLYVEYQSKMIDDTQTIASLKNEIGERSVLFVGPGSSISKNIDKINKLIEKESPIVIMGNFAWNLMTPNYYLFTNSRRLREFEDDITSGNIILTSNVDKQNIKTEYIINYADYAFYNERLFDNCLSIAMKFFKSIGCLKIFLAGFDGFSSGQNFAIPYMESSRNKNDINKLTKEMLTDYGKNLEICFITPSAYQQ